MLKPRVAAIVPAYNEEPTVADVVRTLRACAWVDEVLVVNDASTDGTAQVAEAAGATLLEQPSQKGKGEAMRFGVAHTDAEVLLFADADLIGFTEDHVERILLPVLSGGKMMNVGLRDRGAFWNWWEGHLPLIGGERAMRREIFEAVPPEFIRGFMVEGALNYSCRSRKLSYGSVLLPGLSLRRKINKVGFFRGIRAYVRMGSEILYGMFVVRVAHLLKRF